MQPPATNTRFKKQSGNVLFLILIAVVLFAALSYAVTSSTRTGSGSISKDKAKANAAAIIQYGAALRSAAMRMKLNNGCTDTTLDFSNNIFKTNGNVNLIATNGNAPSDKRCNIFDPSGGNISPVTAALASIDTENESISVSTTPKPGHGLIRTLQVLNIGTDGVDGTASSNDLVFIYPYLNKETCLALNDLLGIPNSVNAPPNQGLNAQSQYINGSYSATGIIALSAVANQSAFCVTGSTYANAYHFVQVLIER